LRAPKNPRYPMATIPLTRRGAELLREELQRLKSVERPAVINAIAEARAHGDLSENAEYAAARERQGFVEGRIAELEAKLANAQVIDPALLDADGRVVFGATVTLEDLDSGEKSSYQIVGDDEADIKAGKISVSSPIARALIGRSVGDTAEVRAPSGVRELEILDVRYE
ncbi:MAG: transcription elongation factor GreA, partial [Burkholderiales bacterium]|nr:transcription elongation factor GreA [Burkholderiales bacterium]